MALEDNLLLYMPFDEKDGATSTYDFSKNRADGIVANAHFEEGKENNCIRFDGDGKCEVQQSVLSLASDFTLTTFVKSHPVASKIIVLFNYNGVNNYFQGCINVEPDKWNYLAVVRENNTIKMYLNGAYLGSDTVPADYGNPIGFAILQDCYNTDLGRGCLDETRIYNKVLSQEDIIGLLDNIKHTTQHLLDGFNFKDFGVFVSSSKGILDALKLKEPLKLGWDGYHGEAVDLSRPRMQARDITLECFIKTEGGKMAFVKILNDFLNLFYAPHKKQYGNTTQLAPAGLHRLTIDIHPVKPLIYEVYLQDGVEIEKEWNERRMVGTFTLKLREPEPVKRILKHYCTSDSTKTIAINISTQKMVNIYWGDGTTTQDVSGTRTITHDYVENGEYYAVVTGVIEDITEFSTNAIIIWSKI
jgi:hypothetical protein